jgi:hypothetical protein
MIVAKVNINLVHVQRINLMVDLQVDVSVVKPVQLVNIQINQNNHHANNVMLVNQMVMWVVKQKIIVKFVLVVNFLKMMDRHLVIYVQLATKAWSVVRQMIMTIVQHVLQESMLQVMVHRLVVTAILANMQVKIMKLVALFVNLVKRRIKEQIKVVVDVLLV